jgi:hypothetical protein
LKSNPHKKLAELVACFVLEEEEMSKPEVQYNRLLSEYTRLLKSNITVLFPLLLFVLFYLEIAG